MPKNAGKVPRFRRYLRRGLYGIGGFLGLAALGVVFLLVSLRFAAARNFLVGRVNSALADSFKGRLQIHDLRSVGLSGIAGADAEVFDPAGRRVLDIHGLDVRLSLPTLAWAALMHGAKPLTITLDLVRLQHAEVLLVDDGTGSPTLADAFAAKTPSAPSSGPGTIILLPRIELTHLWTHGALASTPPLDVELKAALSSLRSAPEATSIAVQHASLRARGLPQGLDPAGLLQGSLNLPAAPEKPLSASAHYQGTAAAIPLVLDASYVAEQLVAKLEASQIPPAAVAKQIPGLELRSPASLTASVTGRLPALHGVFTLGVGAGKLDGDLDVLLQDELTLKANLRASELDAAELSRAAPASKLDFTLHTALLVPKSGPTTGNFELAAAPATLSGQSLPAVSLNGNFSNDTRSERARVEAHAEVAEPGAHTSVDATLTRAQHTAVEFRSSTELLNPPRLKQLAGLRCDGNLQIQGNYQVEAQSVGADIRADLNEIWRGADHVNRAKVRARIAGVIPHPNAEVSLDVADANLAGQHVANATISARGSLSRLALTANIGMLVPQRQIHLSTIVSNDRGILFDHPSVNLSQGNTNLTLSAKRVAILNGHTAVDNLHLEGVGTADASLVYGSNLESATLQTFRLDLARLWRLADPKAPLSAGTATLSLRYDQSEQAPRAQLNLRAENLSMNRVYGGSLHADLRLEKEQLDGTANADLKQLGKLSLDIRALRGVRIANLDPARMSGKLGLEGQLQLRDLSQLLPVGTDLPIARARGLVKYDATVERERPGPGLPALHLHVSTKNLQLAGARRSKTNLTTKQEALAAAPPSIKGLDFELDVTHAEAGPTELATSIKDEHGLLASLSVEGNVAPPLASAASELGRDWRQIPLSVKLTMPAREIEELPVEVRPAGLAGVLSGELAYDGTIAAAQLKIAGKIRQFRQTDVRAPGLDLDFRADYADAKGRFQGSAHSGQREVGNADVDFETALTDWLDQGTGPTPKVAGSAKLVFDGFPIALLPGTQTSQVDGSLSGQIQLKDFGHDASLEAKLEARPFKVGPTQFARIATELSAKGNKALASLRVEDRQGVTTAEAHSGFSWGSKLAPSLVLPADAQLRAKGFRLAAVSPFLASQFGELDGRVNGDLNAHFEGGAPKLDGQIDIDQGVAQVASLGQRFDQIQGHISLQPGKIKLDRLSAHATSGKLDVTAEANLAGLDLTDASAQLRIAKSDAIAISLAGTDIGDCWGAIDVKLQPGNAERSSEANVSIPQLHVHLPDTGSQDVQSLDPAKDVRIGTQQRVGDFVTLPLQPLTDDEPATNTRPMIVDLTLGKEIWVQRGDTTKVQLSGKTQLTLGDPATMTGQIDLRGGTLDVSGKQFEIENGTITFSGAPANPTIVATARWDAPDDEQHRVYADYTGTVKDGKIVLRSEPPLTEDQVLSLLLTGSADGSLGGSSNSSGGSTAGTAVGAVGGAATQGLNKALSHISALDVSTRVDTSTGNARPEVVVQISPKVSAAITRALGTPAPGQPPDLTFLTLDFRIRSHWSLSALVGDRGESGLDLIWRRRY